MSNFKLTGIKELDRKLAKLSKQMERTIARQAARKATKPVLASAKNWVPVSSGDLEASIKIRALKGAKRGTVGARVVTGESLFAGDQYYGGMQEYGTAFAEPQAFLRPAADENEQVVKEIFRREIAAGIKRV